MDFLLLHECVLFLPKYQNFCKEYFVTNCKYVGDVVNHYFILSMWYSLFCTILYKTFRSNLKTILVIKLCDAKLLVLILQLLK